jgi:hypothetical protein
MVSIIAAGAVIENDGIPAQAMPADERVRASAAFVQGLDPDYGKAAS